MTTKHDFNWIDVLGRLWHQFVLPDSKALRPTPGGEERQEGTASTFSTTWTPHHSSLQWAVGLTRGSQKPLHRGTFGLGWMTPQLMHHCCWSCDVLLTPLQLHPTELHSFVLGHAAWMMSVSECDVLISGWFKGEGGGAAQHWGRAGACLCLVPVHAAVGTLDGKLYTRIIQQQQ